MSHIVVKTPPPERGQQRSTRPYKRAAQRQRRKRITTCWICKDPTNPIDYAAPYPEPWSFTLHHIIPINRGGSMLDPGNHSSAHALCNRWQSDSLEPPRPPLPTSRTWL
ncbi:MAG: HNH endonuclease [Phycicoccus sp.]